MEGFSAPAGGASDWSAAAEEGYENAGGW